ncbi:uncharacterized protein LOC121740408 [Aricia agestis]|uniref:uncharacterized protein LOC121740408 n=1 Tax=Aricia agestis TaxID=91739 RepID=UPI001C20A18E|nr:uncharacterized protein LOC121740408 [Aricia agestis]
MLCIPGIAGMSPGSVQSHPNCSAPIQLGHDLRTKPLLSKPYGTYSTCEHECPVVFSLKIIGITVPRLKQPGESVTLVCEYDLEGGKLYSVKWYRDNEEFYRYMPGLIPPQHAHRLDGVKVDLEKSSARRVYLRNLTLKSRGLYRCEISAEKPSFHSAHSEAFMEIYYFPRVSPQIVGHEHPYKAHEPLDVNCTSAESFPAPELQWHINGKKVTDQSWLVAYEPTASSQGLMVSTLGLRAPARSHMRIRCTATFETHKRERIVSIVTSAAHRRQFQALIMLAYLCVHYFYDTT